MKNSISFYTLGCRLNQSETAVIQNTCEALGYNICSANVPTDIAVINTCTVTRKGDTDMRRLVNRIRRINPQVEIALVGCQAQTQKDRLAKIPNVKWIIGNAKKMDIAKLLKQKRTSNYPLVRVPAIPTKSFTLPTTGIDRQHTRVNLKIQDGCNYFCSFCEVPYARGRARSRQFSDILSEAKILVQAGHQEIVVTGINVGAYCEKEKTIIDILQSLDNLKGLERIRISSIELTTIPKQLLSVMSQSKKICRYLHIPLQSGNDDILKLMNRKYSIIDYSRFVQHAKSNVPGICLGTDVIVGFPGETDWQFQDTYEFLKQSPIHYFHVFSYSQRLLAKSKDFQNTIPLNVIQKRSRHLRELSLKKRQAFYKSFLETRQFVLFENKKHSYWKGLTDTYIKIKVKTHRDLSNCIVPVQLKKIEGIEVVAELID